MTYNYCFLFCDTAFVHFDFLWLCPVGCDIHEFLFRTKVCFFCVAFSPNFFSVNNMRSHITCVNCCAWNEKPQQSPYFACLQRLMIHRHIYHILCVLQQRVSALTFGFKFFIDWLNYQVLYYRLLMHIILIFEIESESHRSKTFAFVQLTLAVSMNEKQKHHIHPGNAVRAWWIYWVLADTEHFKLRGQP